MAQIIIEIPDEALPYIKAWVDSRTNAGIIGGWSDAEYARYVDKACTNWLRSEVERSQRETYLKTFKPYDPTVLRSSIPAATAGQV